MIRLGLQAMLCLGALLGSGVQAQVTVNQIDVPSNIGRTLDAAVSVTYTRTTADPAVISVALPPQLGVSPPAVPAGCQVLTSGASQTLQCSVPAGNAADTGSLSFSVRAIALGSFNLAASATGGSTASNAGTVRSSGELTVLQTRAPTGNLLAGQSVDFALRPQLAAGADDLPVGATLTLTDQLPGTATDFTLTNLVVTGVPSDAVSCTSVAAAQTARTLSCVFTGPLTAAQINAVVVTVTGKPGTSGSFVNVGSVAATQPDYFDRNPDNNTASVNFLVDPASDLAASGVFPATAVATGSTQNLVITGTNNGPMSLPAGSTVSTVIPAGFTVNSLPAGCTGPAVGSVLAAPATVTCTTGALINTGAQSFTLPLTMPATATSGNFPVTVATPAGYGDANAANNTVNLPYVVSAPYADLRMVKAKSPASGPLAAGPSVAPRPTVTTTLTVVNDAGSPSGAVYSANGGGTELRVIDYLRPEEVAGDVLSNVSSGWNCSVATVTDPTSAGRTKRVSCISLAGGTLLPGQSASVSFTTTVAPVTGQLVLSNRACTGETVLAELGLTPAQGPQPAGSGQTANDCAVAGDRLVATDVVSGQAAVTLRKESSADGITWVDDPALAPVITAANGTARWRITLTTPLAAPQATIPTLNLGDVLPGILNVSTPGAPAPAYLTPAVTITPSVTAGSANVSCPALAPGSQNLACSFTSVAPGTTIVVELAVQRPFASGLLTNTATVTSPDAILSGTTQDAAALNVAPRIDLATTTKTVTPASPRIGQTVKFTLTTQNLGPDAVSAAGDFKVVDDLNTTLSPTLVAYADIVATGAGMSCTVTGTKLAGEDDIPAGFQRVRCLNTAPVPRYDVRTIEITARVQKPSTLPTSGSVYSGQTNAATTYLGSGLCEFKTETATNANLSAACNDAAATSNNTRSVTFNVLVPQVDLQQRKAHVLPSGQSGFGVGQPLRYRFRLQNNGPSRAEGVTMTDRITLPAGFTLQGNPVVSNVNGSAAESGYTLDGAKTAATVTCAPVVNNDMVCRLAATNVDSYLDANREVNFEVEFTLAGASIVPVTFVDEALVCGDETGGYESSGACNRALANNNNLARVNDTIFPRTDLEITKTTVTPGPVAVNQPVAFDLRVRNNGPHATQQIQISDQLPAGFEQLTGGSFDPTITLGSFVTAAPSTATGAAFKGGKCTPVPAVVTDMVTRQSVVCIVNATPGPYGTGAFPGNADADNTITVRLWARAKEGVYRPASNPANTTNFSVVSPGVDTSGSPPLSIDTVPANNTSSSPVQVASASIAGRVFDDRNGNGAQDGTTPALDEGIGSVTLTLSGRDIYGNTVTRTTASVNTVGATRGDYLFDFLPPGDYTVTETQPSGFVNSAGTPAQPAAPGTGSYTAAASATTSSWTGITLVAAQAATGYLFPESLPGATISGTVYVDRDRNGSQGSGEPGIAGVTLSLYPAGTVCPAPGTALPAGALATTTTNATGAWQFTGITSGNSYVVCELQPAGYGDANPVPGTSGSTPRPNQIDIVSLPLTGAAGQQFPETLASIAGTVFLDYAAAAPGNANNGLQNAGEPGLGSATAGAGVPVTLTGTVSAGPNAGNSITLTTTTAADGSWRFADLFPGNYTVTEGSVPTALGRFGDGRNTAGSVTTGGTPGVAGAVGDNAIRGIDLPAGGASTGNNFAELPGGTISGQVFADGNNDGLRQPGEGGYAGQTVQLIGTDFAGRPVTATTITDANGGYRFTDLPPGTYAVVEPGQPVDSLNGSNHVGSLGGTASNPSGTSSRIDGIVLPIAGSSTANDFGEVPTASSLAGRVWLDNDNSAVQDASETGIPGVTVVLTGTDILNNPVNLTTTTDANGDYRFGRLAPGTYILTEPTQPPNTINGQTLPGSSGGTATATTATPSRISQIPLAALQVSSANNFAEVPNASVITGRVWLDANDNGVIDGTETGLPNVRVVLTGTDIVGNAVTVTVNTDAQGNYRFDTLPPGFYTVTEPTQPAGTFNGRTLPGTGGGSATGVTTAPSAIAGIVLGAGQTVTANNFGEIPPAEVSGRVYFDNNNNGSAETGEAGIGNVRLVLTGTDDLGQPVNATTNSAPDGSWRFPNLRPGTYTVTEPDQPPETLNGITTTGVLGGNATAVGTTPSAIGAIVLPVGGVASGNLFGELGNSPDLRVDKRHSPATLTVNHAATYTLTVRNAGQVATTGSYTVSDRLPAGVTLTATPTGNGWSCTGAAGAGSFACSRSVAIAANTTSADTITAAVMVGNVDATQPLVNAVLVEGGGEIPARGPSDAERAAFNGNPGALPACDVAVIYNACRDSAPVQLAAGISGTAWLDLGSAPRLLDSGDKRLPGWKVEVLDAANQVVGTATTSADGTWRIDNLIPGVPLTVRYRDPVSGVVFGYPVNGETAPGSSGAGCDATAASRGLASSCVSTGADPVLRVVLAPGAVLPQQSLPVDPSGTVYDSGNRQPVPGSIVTLAPVGACTGWDPATQIVGATLPDGSPSGYTISGNGISMTVGDQGAYLFLFGPSAPARCDFSLTVQPPAGYTAPSRLIPPAPGTAPSGALGTTVNVQPQAGAPTAPVGAGTVYYTTVVGGSNVANLVHNHIPLDPAAPGGLTLSKTGDRAAAEVGDSVRYTITVQLTSGARARQTSVVDRLPAGLTYIRGTAMVNGVAIADPAGGVGPVLTFQLGAMPDAPAAARLVLQYRVRIGVGSQQGDGINRAQAFACQSVSSCVGADGRSPLVTAAASNTGEHRVRVSGGVFDDAACLMGKVFVDCNGNHVQDSEEIGIPGVRLVLQDGTTLVSDVEGKYSVCGLPPKSHVLRIDPRTLPRGARLTTSSNRNLGDAGSLWLDLKNGELHRADFVEGSCSNTVLEQVKARRAQGEIRAPETERPGTPALRFDSKAHGLTTFSSPQQGTDGANQAAPKPRSTAPAQPGAPDEQHTPTPALPMNQPPPTGRPTGTAPQGGSDASR